MNKDLTNGNPQSVLWRFCLPMFGSVIFQQLYNIADSFVAGKCIDEKAIAAVGNSYNITLIFIAFAFGCNIGCSVLSAKFFGAKDNNKLRTAVYTTFISSIVLCLILMLVGLLCGDLMLRLMGTHAEVFADSSAYLRIYVCGLPFLFFYNISNGIFSALGDSKTPFYFLAASSTANIAVDFIFVKYIGLGVPGLAWATFLCQGISCILAFTLVLVRLSKIEVSGKVQIFSRDMFLQLAHIAIPSILQQSFVSVGNMMVQNCINGFGIYVAAGYAVAVKLNNLVISSFVTIGNGISNFTAQNLGANKKDRIPLGFKAGIKLIWILCIPFCLLYMIFGKQLILFFLDPKDYSALALSTGREYLWILSPFYFMIAAKLAADGVLRGLGKMKAFMTSTFTDLILRVVLAFILSSVLNSATGIWLAWPIGWGIATIISYVWYKRSV